MITLLLPCDTLLDCFCHGTVRDGRVELPLALHKDADLTISRTPIYLILHNIHSYFVY